jgi:hypothetical protein
MTPQDFQAKWGPGGPAYHLNERQGAQSYFADLCTLLGVPQPAMGGDAKGDYIFEKQTLALGQQRGFADVFKRGAFAWENKAPGKDLGVALKQLLGYSHALDNPPLLVVCDRLTTIIHTQFTGHPTVTHEVKLAEMDLPDKQALLRRVWLDPESFRPQQTTRDITEKAAHSFATLADQLRKRGHDAEKVAHFLTQCLFCFFAEDVGLLPDRMFEKMLNARLFDNRERLTPSEALGKGLGQLFVAMRDGGMWGGHYIPYFNGGLFKTIDVPKLEITDVTELRNAANLNWSFIDVSIFGTLFERGLDPAKRSQLGAHYTDPATIMRIIDPVVRRPLLQKWELLVPVLQGQLAKSKKMNDAAYKLAHAKYIAFLESLADFKILDPACGSGNFLFLGLKTLKDIELKIINEADRMGLERPLDLCTSPANMLGIEINEFAAELARVTVWIGELQWRVAHGYGFNYNPVLEPLDCIEHRDALMTQVPAATASAVRPASPSVRPEPVEGLTQYIEAEWPQASVVIGNPPFLGGSKKRGELGDTYFEALKTVFKDRVPGFGDLVCYWFAKALKAIESNGLGAAGFVSTNSIRGGANRKVLDAICERSNIFEAWSDEGWVNNGAAVRVSLICFGYSSGARLNGLDVGRMTSQLEAPLNGMENRVSSSVEYANTWLELNDVSKAKSLATNLGASFQGASKKAKFEIDAALAREWLRLPNPNGQPNSDVLKPWANGFELSRGAQHQWIIDFGNEMLESEAALYEQPFAHVLSHIKPERILKTEPSLRDFWWRFGRPRIELRVVLKPLKRYIATVAHSKHRFFVWLPVTTSPDQALITFARADDTNFGILHSRFHELWSLRLGTSIGVGNDPRYTPTTTFETFPFPAGLTPADTAHQRTEVLADGALIPAALGTPAVMPEASPSAKAARAPNKVPKQATARQNIAQAATNSVALKHAASQIASAAKRLNDLREAWLNPPEWTQRVPEVVPLGMATSPYPDRILPRDKLSEADLKQLQKRTLTNLYNQRPSWLQIAHQQLDAAVAAAYGWADYSADMPDADILARLLALNHARSAR